MSVFDNDEVKSWERMGEKGKPKEVGEYYERWNNGVMDDVPEFAGDGQPDSEVESGAVGEVNPGESPEADGDGELGGASKLTSYGFDTACRIYGLGTVLKAVEDTDETGRDVENPLGAVYQRIAPTADERAYLYQEIKKETARDNRHNTDTELYENSRMGLDSRGDFYDRAEANGMAESTQALSAMKRLLEILATDERFAEVRETAKMEGKTTVEYLVGDSDNPTLTDLFNRIGVEMGDIDVEEVAEEIADIVQEKKEGDGGVELEGSDEIGAEEPGREDNGGDGEDSETPNEVAFRVR